MESFLALRSEVTDKLLFSDQEFITSRSLGVIFGGPQFLPLARVRVLADMGATRHFEERTARIPTSCLTSDEIDLCSSIAPRAEAIRSALGQGHGYLALKSCQPWHLLSVAGSNGISVLQLIGNDITADISSTMRAVEIMPLIGHFCRLAEKLFTEFMSVLHLQ